MINDSGEKISSYQLIETGRNIDLGKVRIREDAYTVGKLKEGDRIALILTNATFASTPDVMAPPTSLDNQYGRTGDFDLVKVPGTGEAGNNAVIYELKKTSVYTNYRRLDYVLDFNNINVEKEEMYTFILLLEHRMISCQNKSLSMIKYCLQKLTL
jgi:hypothetical protein